LDRILTSKVLLYIALGLAIVYLWNNYWWLSNAVRVFVSDWWH
jgi:hypothetical protein